MTIDIPSVTDDLGDLRDQSLTGATTQTDDAGPATLDADDESGSATDGPPLRDESAAVGGIAGAGADAPPGWGGVVSQVPLQTDPDLMTSVDEVRSSPGYLQWQADTADDSVIGDVSDADFWFQQSTDFTCAPAAATQIVEDFTGVDYADETEVSDYATQHGLLDEEGMTPDDLATLLTDLGVPSQALHDQTWEDVARYLAEGRSVVLYVDSGDYWPGFRDGTDGVDHAVRIVAIDTERGVAILSDSGHPDGHQLEVPLDELDEAWSNPTVDEQGEVTEDRQLIVSESPDPTPDAAADPFADTTSANGRPDGSTIADGLADAFTTPADGDSPDTPEGIVERVFANPAGWVVLPVELAASRIFPALSA